MTPERWKQVEELFERVADLPSIERDQILGAAEPGLRDEVYSLLDCDAKAAGAVEQRVRAGAADLHLAPAPEVWAGPYLLRQELGRGGMGTVYRGERADGRYEGEVAIKLLHPGMDTGIFLERFQRERRALAKLRHPNIARLLDSGTAAGGSPYLVMELVPGQPIHEWCAARRLPAGAILELFLPVCRAVAYAHQQLIVHRDIKPGNILVTADGTPKLLDFGICKSLDGFDQTMTSPGAQMLTPAFASPEQVLGEPITPASDIYGLGAVLYLLLTGRSPHELANHTAIEIVRAVCEVAPAAPGISADIDTILLKSLQKDPVRRYHSAEQLAEDLRRVLADEPILARPDSPVYRARKFIRRHRVGVAASLLVTLGLIFGVLAYASQAAHARRQSAEARRLANAMIFDIHDKLQDVAGSLEARQEIVKIGLDYLDRMAAEAVGDPGLRRELAGAYLRMGNVQGSVLVSHTGDVNGAIASYRKGLAALEGVALTPDSRLTWFQLNDRLAMILRSRDLPGAIRLFEPLLPAARMLVQEAPDDTQARRRLADVHSQMSLLLRDADPPRSLENALAAVEILRTELGRRPADSGLRDTLAGALANAGSAQFSLRQTAAARDSFRESIRHRELLRREAPANGLYARMLMLSYGHLGDALGNPNYPQNLGDSAGAAAAFTSMLEIAEESHRQNHGDKTAAVDLGMALARVAGLPLRPVPERLQLYERSGELLGEVLRHDPGNVALQVQNLRHLELAAELQPGIAGYERVLRSVAPTVLANPAGRRIAITAHQKLGLAAARGRESSAAVAHGRKALGLAADYERKETNAADRLVRARAYWAIGEIMQATGSPEARVWMERAARLFQADRKDPAFTGSHPIEFRRLEAALAASSTARPVASGKQ